MKRILYLILAITMIAGCDKGGDDSPITGYDRTQLNQTLYADQTKGDFNFTATASWTTQIADVTPAQRATASDIWITLDPSQGDAGGVNMKITLTPNLTGKDRTAMIKIVCGDMTITITVEQKATTESGDEPEPEIPATAKVISRINSFINGAADGYVTFEYDAQGRTKLFCIYDKANVLESRATMTYTEREIKMETYNRDGDYTDTDVIGFTLDANGRVVFHEETIEGKVCKFDYTYDVNGYLTDYYDGASWDEVIEPPVHGSRAEPRPIMNHAVWENGNMKTFYDDWQNGTYRNKTEYEYTNYKNGFATIDLMMGAMNSALLILNHGAFGKIRKNLIHRETVTGKELYNAGVHNWSYKFDGEGYVTEFTRAFTAVDSNPNNSYTESYKIIYK